jgi:hypothetical protein
MEVEQSAASLSSPAEGAPILDVCANGGLVETPAGDAVGDPPEELGPEASSATEEEPSASPKPKAAVSPDAKPLKKIGVSPLQGTTTAQRRTTLSSAGTPSVRKVGVILYLHLHESSLNRSTCLAFNSDIN